MTKRTSPTTADPATEAATEPVPSALPGTIWVPVKDVHTDTRINRPVEEKRVDKIARDFNVDALGVLNVSHRVDAMANNWRGYEEYVYLDGQHRGTAMVRIGWGDQSVECKVHEGLTLEDEARLFVILNDTRSPARLQVFLKEITAGAPVPVGINAIVTELGMKIGVSSVDSIAAVDALQSVYCARPRAYDGPQALRTTLAIIKAAYGATNESMVGLLIRGLGGVILEHGPAVDQHAMATVLAQVPGGAPGLIGQSKGLVTLSGGTVTKGVAQVAVNLYNKRRRSSRLGDA